MINKIFKIAVYILLLSLIAHQSCKVYKLEKKIENAEKNGQLKCQRPY